MSRVSPRFMVNIRSKAERSASNGIKKYRTVVQDDNVIVRHPTLIFLSDDGQSLLDGSSLMFLDHTAIFIACDNNETVGLSWCSVV